MKLIADSGSTKTDWRLITDNSEILKFSSQGINPFQQSEQMINEIICHEVVPQVIDVNKVNDIFFYGAGCREEVCGQMSNTICSSFTNAKIIEVNNDLLAAARALCGNEEGIACILGTGANSCMYDGKKIISNIPPLGYILGDEGSGAVLGRNLVNSMFKGLMSNGVIDTFSKETGLTLTDVIHKVYREPMANRFLASLSLFVGKHIEEFTELRNLVIDNFRAFFHKNICQYKKLCHHSDSSLVVNVVGSMAFYYSNELKTAASIEGFTIGKIERSPIERLVEYHINEH